MKSIFPPPAPPAVDVAVVTAVVTEEASKDHPGGQQSTKCPPSGQDATKSLPGGPSRGFMVEAAPGAWWHTLYQPTEANLTPVPTLDEPTDSEADISDVIVEITDAPVDTTDALVDTSDVDTSGLTVELSEDWSDESK